MTDYDPINHAFTARQVIAGWIVCLGVGSLAIGLTAIHADDRAARAAATMPEYSLCCLRTPQFSVCRGDRSSSDVAQKDRGEAVRPSDSCA